MARGLSKSSVANTTFTTSNELIANVIQNVPPEVAASNSSQSYSNRRIPSSFGWFHQPNSEKKENSPQTRPQRDGSLKSRRFTSLFRTHSPCTSNNNNNSTDAQVSSRSLTRIGFPFRKRQSSSEPLSYKNTAVKDLRTTQPFNPPFFGCFRQSNATDSVAKIDNVVNSSNPCFSPERLESFTLEPDNRHSTFTRDEASANSVRHSPLIGRHSHYLHTDRQPFLDSLITDSSMPKEEEEIENQQTFETRKAIAADMVVRRLEREGSRSEWNDDDSDFIAAASIRHRLQQMKI